MKKKGSSRVGLDVFFYGDQRNIFEHHKLHHHVPVAKKYGFLRPNVENGFSNNDLK